MKFIACADLHIRSTRPRYRKDDYFKTVCDKFEQIISLSNKYQAHLVIAGDFFDSVKVGHKVVNAVLEIMSALNQGQRVFVCAGQHDMSYHTHDLSSSPLQTVIQAGRAEMLTPNCPILLKESHKDIWLYGCSFGQTPIKSVHKNAILVIHKPITKNEPPFFLTDAVSSEDFLKEYAKSYFLIIAGDFHEPFKRVKFGSVLINCGPMMRQSIDQAKLKPRVWFIDTAAKKVFPLFLNIEPAEFVFAFENVKQKEESAFSKELNELVKTLKNNAKRPDYKETVNLVMKKGKVVKRVRNKVNSIIEEALNG